MLIRLLIFLLLTCPLSAQAALTIQGTRIIYDEARGEATVLMRYDGDTPTLLQMWLDTGDETALPGSEEIAFIITPAVARLDPGSGQTVRILRVGEGMAGDRESVLYFNTLEVPPAPSAQLSAGEPFMQFSIRGRFKFFYRPKGLPSSVERAPELLRFAIADEPLPDGRLQLQISNASPYHITFSTLHLRLPGDADLESTPHLAFDHDTPSERMVPPLGELLIPLEWGEIRPGDRAVPELAVHYTIINDAGGIQPGQGRVEP